MPMFSNRTLVSMACDLSEEIRATCIPDIGWRLERGGYVALAAEWELFVLHQFTERLVMISDVGHKAIHKPLAHVQRHRLPRQHAHIVTPLIWRTREQSPALVALVAQLKPG